MFSEVNSLVFLLIFLSCMAGCLMVYHRVAAPCPDRDMGWEIIQKLLLCGLLALLLTVLVIYLWYLAVIALLLAAKYLCDRCMSKKIKCVLLAGTLILSLLIATAGIQLMVSRNAEDCEDEDAVLEDVIENGTAWDDRICRMAANDEEKRNEEKDHGRLQETGTCTGHDAGEGLDLSEMPGG